MKYYYILLFLLMFSCTSQKKNNLNETELIKKTFILFFKLCKDKNIEAAKKLVAKTVENAPKDYVNNRIIKYGKITPKLESIAEIKVLNKKSVIAYYESPTDLDPIFFTFENGKWKILLPLTKFEHPVHKWSNAELKTFNELNNWFTKYASEKLRN